MIRRLLFAVVALAASSAAVVWLAPRATLVWRLATAAEPASLPLPLELAGRAKLTDSWGAARRGAADGATRASTSSHPAARR
jgi:hypothetical protein